MTSLADPGRLAPLASSSEISLAASAGGTLHLRRRWARARQSQGSCIRATNLPSGQTSVKFHKRPKRHVQTHIYQRPVLDLVTLFSCEEVTAKDLSTHAVIERRKW